MNTFLFYTSEGKTYSPTNVLCENYQILGFASGNSQKEAFDTFLINNLWVSEYGFSFENIMTRQVATK